MDDQKLSADVLVIGSGAGGATVAGAVAAAGASVILAEAGPERLWPRGHARNLDPTEAGLESFGALLDEHLVYPSVSRKHSPGLSGFKVAHGVGGMFALWTSNCPRPHRDELPAWDDPGIWQDYLGRAEKRLKIRHDMGSGGFRATRILDSVSALLGPFPDDRPIRLMPVAYAPEGEFTSVHDLMGSQERIRLVPDLIVQSLLREGGRVTGAVAVSATTGQRISLSAGKIVVAAGTIGSAKLLANSGLDTVAALGRGIFDHPAIASRVRLRRDIREGIPPGDPLFTIWIPYSPAHPWHNQICRFPVAPAPVLPDCPGSETMDIFTWVPMDIDPDNRLVFDMNRRDPFGLPDVSAEVSLSDADRRRASLGLAEHFCIAAEIGDLSEGWFPAFYRLGESTHLMGSCRMGPQDDGTSVVDVNGRVWGMENLYVAGNAVLARSNAGNPTLTTIAAALRCADAIAG